MIHMIPKLAPQKMPSSWSTNPPPTLPPQKFGFNKAFLRETNGLIRHHPDDSDFAYSPSYDLILQGIYRGIAGWCWFNVAFILRHSRLGRLAHHWVPDSTLCQRTLLGGKRGNVRTASSTVGFGHRAFGVVWQVSLRVPKNKVSRWLPHHQWRAELLISPVEFLSFSLALGWKIIADFLNDIGWCLEGKAFVIA